jgi:hypothetical protein
MVNGFAPMSDVGGCRLILIFIISLGYSRVFDVIIIFVTVIGLGYTHNQICLTTHNFTLHLLNYIIIIVVIIICIY